MYTQFSLRHYQDTFNEWPFNFFAPKHSFCCCVVTWLYRGNLKANNNNLFTMRGAANEEGNFCPQVMMPFFGLSLFYVFGQCNDRMEVEREREKKKKMIMDCFKIKLHLNFFFSCSVCSRVSRGSNINWVPTVKFPFSTVSKHNWR